MKFRFLALLALVLGLASCQNDPYGLEVDSKGEAAVTLNVALPDDATRAAGTDSAMGGVTNVDKSQYDIRYILEVYDENGVLAKERMAHTTDATTTSFSFRLVPGRPYNFVVWADFVLNGTEADLHYNTNADNKGLRKVKVIENQWDVIDESRDAYTDVVTVHNFSSAADIPTITLTRPFAKLRVVTNDIKEMISVRPAEVKVKYFNTKFYDTFDAFAETASGEYVFDDDDALTATLLDSQKNPVDVYSGGLDAQDGVQTLFADYFFGAEDDRVMFTMDVKDNGGRDLPQVTFNTNIPVGRNKLTTVYGPVLTDSNNITVTINEAFENGTDWNPDEDEYDVAVWDGQSTNEPAYDPATKTYTIKNGDELAWLADQVNGVTRAASNAFSGYNFVLAKDINLGDNEWTPIGGSGKHFAGTFDGKNYTVSNFQVTKQDGHAALFGNARATIKNLNVENVKIVSHHYAGAIVGQGYSKIDGCHVDNIDITLTTKDGDLGDKAGGIIGQNCEGAGMYVKNSTAKNVTIKGYRDLGGIAGMVHNSNTVSGCSVENITILQDLSVNYEDNTPTTLGAVIGRKGTNVIDENNTVGEGIEIAVLAANLEQLQAALDAAKAGQTNIHIVADIEGDVMVQQKTDVNIIVDGKEHKYDGTIQIHNGSGYNNGAIAIKNVNFETNRVYINDNGDKYFNFIMPHEFGTVNGVTRRYSNNVTVENCSFTATGDAVNYAVGVQAKACRNLQVIDCVATGVHSLLQAQSCDNDVIVKGSTISGKNGVAFKQVKSAVVEGTTINAVAYGIRFDGNVNNYGIIVKDNSITAAQPFIVRKMTGKDNTITLEGNNTLDTNEAYQIIITNGSDDEAYVTPTGTYTLTGADNYTIFPVKPVAKVGNTEYLDIDEAIANWTNNTTLTLMDNVTLSDVVTIKSTEHHTLNLGTYTLTAAEGKNAFEITACGTGASERYAITINADATNPGSINAGNKAIVYYDYSKGTAAGADDRPIIQINGGVFYGSTAAWGTAGIYFKGGSKARQAATLNISGGEFHCAINGQTKSKLIISGGLFHYSVGSQGDSTANRLISGGTFKTLGFMTADSNNTKFWFGTSMGNSNVGLYINDDNYLVVGGPVITEFGSQFKAKATNATKWSGYLQYSSAAANGLYYTNAEMAIQTHGEANVVLP